MSKNLSKHPVNEIFEGVSAHLKFLSELGVRGVGCSEKSRGIITEWGVARASQNRFSSGTANFFIKCRNCSLVTDPQQIVSGDGNQKARLVIVGGVAGPEDVQAGKPFSGRAGDLLIRMIAAMGLTRDEVYITRALKCCVPPAQKPKLTDVNICRSYLDKELRTIKPIVICAFGEIAAMSLLETSVPLSRLRGRFHDYKGMRVMPTYSPEYLLENAEAKRIVWEDLKQVIEELKKKY